MADSLKVGSSYRLYGKMNDMKRMKPVAGSQFVTNLIYAPIFVPDTPECIEKMEQELKFLANQGAFEYRKIQEGDWRIGQ